MKRTGNLLNQIAETDNLLSAYYKAVRGKRMEQEAKAFERHLEENIDEMRNAILSGTIEVGHYSYFQIHDPKLRTICAASFPERVLHHAIMNVCHQYFERNLISTTYATRPEKGVYKAIDYAKKSLRIHPFVAKFDFRKYFDSISHSILKEKLCRIFKDKNLLLLFEKIIDSYSKSDDRGVPIGNLTSQYFANYYLSSFDHWIKENIHIPDYVRYMDDFLVFGDTRDEVADNVKLISEYAEKELLLTLKPVMIARSEEGVQFLGYNVFPEKIKLCRRSKKRLMVKSRMYEWYLEEGCWNQNEYKEHIVPLISFARKAYTKGLRNTIY